MRETVKGYTTYRIHDSIEDLLAVVEQVDEQRCETYRPSRDKDDVSFIGRRFRGWDEAYKAAREPWAEGLAVLDRMLPDLDGAALPKPTSRRRKTRFTEDDGDELDYDRLRSGRAFWRTSRRQNTRGPATVTIIVDMGANCSVDHQDILWRGASAVAATKILEEAGYRVELWAVAYTDGVWSMSGLDDKGHRFDRNALEGVCLKRPGDPLDESSLISAVSGWFYRTMIFRAYCQGNWWIQYNLGHAATPSDADLDQITPDRQRVLIAGAFSYQEAIAQVREKLNSITTN